MSARHWNRSVKTGHKPFVLPQNNLPANLIAYNWLMKARAQGEAQPHYLHLLSLASWGLKNRVQGEWPAGNRYALQDQVDGLFGWGGERDGLAAVEPGGRGP
jgi:hypothetical protein